MAVVVRIFIEEYHAVRATENDMLEPIFLACNHFAYETRRNGGRRFSRSDVGEPPGRPKTFHKLIGRVQSNL